MSVRSLLFFLCVSMVVLTGQAQQEAATIRNYYIGLSYDGTSLELGQFEGRFLSKIPLAEVPLEKITKETIDRYFQLSDGSELLLYLHCWLGNESHFHRVTVDGINETIGQGTGIRKTVSILWHSDIAGYQANWDLALEKGRRIYRVLGMIDALSPKPLNVLCHSMGNRVFEGVLSASRDTSMDLHFGDVVLAAADLDADVFERTLSVLPRQATRVHVFHHSNDRLLLASEMLHGRNRLGLDGPARPGSLLEKFPNLFIVDATNTSDWLNPDLSNHVYFYWSSQVRVYLKSALSHDPLPSSAEKRIVRL